MTIERRHLILALAMVLALALTAPTLARNTRSVGAVAKDAKRIAKTAKHKAKRAKRIGWTGKRRASKARDAAALAASKAEAANAKAGEAGAKADTAAAKAGAAGAKADAVARDLAARQAASQTATATVNTSDETAYQDLGGPAVDVRVPASGLIEVWAQATIVDGAISLYEDGRQLPGQDPSGVCDGPEGVLLSLAGSTEVTLATPGGASIAFCGNTNAPAPVLLEATPGRHTYELRYADCGCDPAGAQFSDRTLTVAPRP